eukprot:577697-Amphidinium_carterae.1
MKGHANITKPREQHPTMLTFLKQDTFAHLNKNAFKDMPNNPSLSLLRSRFGQPGEQLHHPLMKVCLKRPGKRQIYNSFIVDPVVSEFEHNGGKAELRDRGSTSM